ncbi:putative sulfate exporter family transporter [Azospirillum sp. SYSU D00513]|uniref:YeiH family protein n=1 Tax=Azospirillum sp. SYSU D00513 TaxID=2812561 RepID=UPI001A972AA1|nr:putative sulfate exporter family transporter [Azospirillum sp. SYSU D00513]
MPSRSPLPTVPDVRPLGAHPGVDRLRSLLPGLLLCGGVTLLAFGVQRLEEAVFGRTWLEPLVLAILFGTTLRTAWSPGPRWEPGIGFGGKTLLEVAVMLLGASFSAGAVLAAGPLLLLGIAGVVALAIPTGYGIGRLLGLPHRLAILVAGGNAICGNSAIAAIAPAIDAHGEEVAASIAFTAVLGVLVVLGLPLAVPALGLSDLQYGLFAGLTVYAVPQVVAATAPVSALSVQVGTLVKLVRVLTLAPAVLLLSRFGGRDEPAKGRLAAHHAVPWFILGFLGLAGLRTAGLIPEAALAPLAAAADAFTVLSMAALGLGVDVRVVARAGGRVTAAAVLSLLALGALSLGLIRLLGIL